ncbi:MAG TPA: STAS domain-containing protein [Flavisolibacter sp.]|jgi:anti-anti-sigma factor|nr:STAS domain-containing protein [Flavisolibacter sp.]
MEVKTSTKEKFHVITVESDHLSANMTEALIVQLNEYLSADVKNLVLNLEQIQRIDEESGEALVKCQQTFYESAASFVVCSLQPEVETFLDDKGLLELMNVTPTQSEAGEIVQMEEIERELLGDEELL